MLSSSFLSRAAQAAGVPARFHYWRGRSERPYLFTATDRESVLDCPEGVVIAVMSGRIAWVGEGARFAAVEALAIPHDAALSVHLLASSPEERRAVIDDLRRRDRANPRLSA